MAEKKEYMGGNKVRDGNAVGKIAKETGVDSSRLKQLVEAEKKGGTDNLSFKDIKQIADTIKKK
jgi:LysM repeat protein